jgi:putative FmdB family regulatory protein
MPTYEYECTKCAHRFERFQSITAEPLKRCPACRSKVRRLLGTGAGIIFKGSGFYQTDYRSDSYKRGKRSDEKPSAASDTSGKKDAKASAKKGS